MYSVLRIPRGSFSFSEFALDGDLASFPDHQPALCFIGFATLLCHANNHRPKWQLWNVESH